MPYFIIVKLFFALFGLSSERDVDLTPENPDNLKYFQVRLKGGEAVSVMTFTIPVCIHPVPAGDNHHPDQPPDCHDERHLPTYSATIRHGVEVWEIKIDHVRIEVIILSFTIIDSLQVNE